MGGDGGRVVRKFRVAIDPALCKGCGICVEFCPEGVFTESGRLGPRGYLIPEVARPEKCRGCMLCEHLCPDMAVSVLREKARRGRARPSHSSPKKRSSGME